MPPKIPTFNAQVQKDVNVTPYKNVSAPVAAFDTSMGTDDVGRGMIYGSRALDEFYDKKDKLAATDLFNQFDSTSTSALYNKDNGYFQKTGKAAVDSMKDTLDALSQEKDKIISSAGNGRQKQYATDLLNTRYTNIEKQIGQYALEQHNVWKKDTMNTTIDNNLQQAILNKYDTKEIYSKIGNIRTSIAEFSGETDPTILKKMQDDATSKVHIAVIQGRLGDKALNAQDYFNAHKGEIDAAEHEKIEQMIKTNDADVRSRLFADDWHAQGLTEEQAYEKAHAIKDLDLRDATESKVNQVYGRNRELEKQQYNDNLDKFWNDYEKNPDVNNIPAWMDGKDRITAKNYAEQITNGGRGKSDPETYIDLYDKSITNADDFVKINLNDYRDKLTSQEYKTFAKRQQDIIQHGYTTITPDDTATKKVIDSVVGTYGMVNKPNKQNIASIMQNIINEEEKRTGQKYSEPELKAAEQRIAGWLGYSKDASSIKVITQNATKADFYRGLENDIMYFEKTHKRQPDQKEFHSILYQRANYALQDHNQNVYENVKSTIAKPHETKEVTYYADNYLSDLSRQHGTKYNVVQGGRYNPKAKGYNSYHNVNGVTQATDVSMSEHSTAQKIKFFESELSNPLVKKIGTSDASIIKRFAGNQKLADERTFDKQHGTNHVDHAHVTLNVGGGATVVQKPSAPAGKIIVADKDGNKFYLPEGQLAEALKQGYKKL